MNNKLLNNKGVAIYLAILVLTGILIVSLGAANLVVNGLKMSKTQYDSTKAYFAAEAGAERVLWEIRKNNFAFKSVDNIDCQINDYINFDNTTIPPAVLAVATCGSEQINTLSNGVSYSVILKSMGTATSTQSVGIYGDTIRVIEVSY
jgi:Tfp pilus assembly protein PilX